LQNFYNREGARLEQLQQKMEKATLKTIEKEFRQMNIKCNVESSRGQHCKGANRKDKYQNLTHADSDAQGFYTRHSSKRGGARLMLEIQRKTKCLADQIRQKAASLEDKTSNPFEIAKITDGSEQESYLMEQLFDVSSPQAQCEEVRSMRIVGRTSDKDGEAARPYFVRLDTEFEQSADLRGKSKKDIKRPATAADSGGSSSMTVGACLKLPRKDRELLQMLGFENCNDLLALPPFADLHRGYKKVSLKLHPDKKSSEATLKARDGDVLDCNLSSMSFQDFQNKYREFQAMFYDVDKQDFNATVKMHLPKVKTKSACLRSSR